MVSIYLESINISCMYCIAHTLLLRCSGSETGGGSNNRSHDLSSDVTLQSCDTWGGLAPPTRKHPVPSDTVSV